MSVFHVVPVGGDHCDFCTVQPVTKLYPCENFEWEGRPVFASESIGKVRAWAACEKCAELVDSNQWDRLSERALQHFLRGHKIPNSAVMTIQAQMRQIHGLFKDHRIQPS